MVTSAVVVQFKEDFLGTDFLKVPETREIKDLFKDSMQGLQIGENTCAILEPLIVSLESEEGIIRIIKLLECVHLINKSRDYRQLSTQNIGISNPRDMERIDQVFRYTIDEFANKITLDDVAAIAGLSVPAFCNYFKKSTKKTYIDFLNEVRVGYACKLLIDTDLSIVNICYESGYNTLANFNKQFLKIKRETPSKYRRLFANSKV